MWSSCPRRRCRWSDQVIFCAVQQRGHGGSSRRSWALCPGRSPATRAQQHGTQEEAVAAVDGAGFHLRGRGISARHDEFVACGKERHARLWCYSRLASPDAGGCGPWGSACRRSALGAQGDVPPARRSTARLRARHTRAPPSSPQFSCMTMASASGTARSGNARRPCRPRAACYCAARGDVLLRAAPPAAVTSAAAHGVAVHGALSCGGTCSGEWLVGQARPSASKVLDGIGTSRRRGLGQQIGQGFVEGLRGASLGFRLGCHCKLTRWGT